MDPDEIMVNKHPKFAELYKLGYLLVGAGILLFIDQEVKTGWLTFAIPVIAGSLIVIYAWMQRRPGWTIAGSLLTGIGAGLIIGLLIIPSRLWIERAGTAVVAFSAGWLMIFILTSLMLRKTQWWSLVVFSVTLASGIFLWLYSGRGIFTYAVWLSASLGLVLLVWGVARRLPGLIIAGCIIITVAPGMYYGWVNNATSSTLVRIGTMLVWFALGWFIISFIGRIVFLKFIWWPIIPGGVLAMVGWGMYIGGTAGKELGFISNTGSIALILFGVYLILLKYSLRK